MSPPTTPNGPAPFLYCVTYRVSKSGKTLFIRLYDTRDLLHPKDVTADYARPGAKWIAATSTLRVAASAHLPTLFDANVVYLD